MQRFGIWWMLVMTVAAAGCAKPPRPPRPFDQIRDLVLDKTEFEVERLLGMPDARQRLLADDERWTWWNYTVLDGNQYPPEIRHRPVHLVITFSRPLHGEGAHPGPQLPALWRARGPLAVSSSTPLGAR